MKETEKKETKPKKKKPKASSQSFYILDNIYELLSEDAEDEERSRSFFVNKVLKEYYQKQGRLKVDAKKKRRRKIVK